jgi:hypothetical protein
VQAFKQKPLKTLHQLFSFKVDKMKHNHKVAETNDLGISGFSRSALHSIGNGKKIAYGEGADIIQVFGPLYSSPSWLSATFDPDGIKTNSVREPGTAVWKHILYHLKIV